LARPRAAATPEEHKRQERAYADAHAATYYHEMYQGPWPLYRARIEERLYRHLPRPRRVVDIGCGPIPSLPTVYEHAERYTCVDQSPGCLARLRLAYPRAEVVEADAEGFRVEGAFDLVVIIGVLHHVPEPPRVIEAAAALLRPAGLIVGMEPNERGEAVMDSPNERGIPDVEFDALYGRFEVLERWAWFVADYWMGLVERVPLPERPRRWADPTAWFAAVEDEERHMAEGGLPSMNVIIARRR